MSEKKLVWHNEKRKVNDLIPYEKNPRKLTEEQKKFLEKSLTKFNLMSIPTINTDNTIISGHQRVKILQLLGRGNEEIDVRVPNRKLTEAEMREANLLDNKTQELGEWDFDLLKDFDVNLLKDVEFSDTELGIPDVEFDEPPALDKVGLFGAIRKVAQTDFARRFNKDFFNEKTRDLIMLFNYRALKFRMGEIKYETDDPDNGAQFPYFLIDEGVLRQLKIDQEKKEQIEKKMCFSAFEIDDDLLGYFEEIGSYEKQGLLDVQDVYNYFSWYMNVIWNSEEIQKYIESQKAEEAEDIYEDFKYIYEKCTSYRKAKLSGRCMWIWKIKWRLCKKLRLI